MTYKQQNKLESINSRTSSKIHKALAGRLKPSDEVIVNKLKEEGKRYVN